MEAEEAKARAEGEGEDGSEGSLSVRACSSSLWIRSELVGVSQSKEWRCSHHKSAADDAPVQLSLEPADGRLAHRVALVRPLINPIVYFAAHGVRPRASRRRGSVGEGEGELGFDLVDSLLERVKL